MCGGIGDGDVCMCVERGMCECVCVCVCVSVCTQKLIPYKNLTNSNYTVPFSEKPLSVKISQNLIQMYTYR